MAGDRDAFSHRGGHRVFSDIVKRIAAGIAFLLPQRSLRDVGPYSEPLPLERFEEEAIKQSECVKKSVGRSVKRPIKMCYS